ncbi:hypothetical protein RPMA_24785 [Tardiphaga alba]|uniref:Uncharacterized protein n=1 Tax=Tardiphaga alba TaxID=340268 RepID=A0ABX8AD87_9BRAD|nr:hypothetical protein [Tardiphaga alba]QUS41708.1 hypothetical protein RPMA_24785 [Tardiphaga alba]
MKFIVGCLAATGLALASAAQAQVLPPMRGDVRVSDFEEPGPYAAMPPRIYVPGPRYGDGYAPSVLPPHEIYAVIREAGFSPLGAPQQRGLVYTVAAVDRRGEDGRMVIDARTGRILRFMPAYQMGDRMNEEVVSRYGPQAALPELPQYRRPPFDPKTANAPAAAPAPKQKVASQTATVPLPKAPPVKAVATPAKPVVVEKPPVIDKPIAEKPAEPAATPAPAPVQQSAVTEPKPAEAAAPEAAPVAPAAETKETPPIATSPVVEAKPETPAATEEKPAVVKGLE